MTECRLRKTMLSDDRPHIGQNIRRARLAANLTQEKLAAMIGLSQSHTSRLEHSPNPRDFTIRRVADALKIPFAELKPPPPKKPPTRPWPPHGLRWIRIVMLLTAPLRTTHYLSTPAAQQAIADAGQKTIDFLDRNAIGDWGEVDELAAALNDQALRDGGQIVSQYTTRLDAKVVVVTDAADDDFGQRDNTTIYFPEEWEARELGGQKNDLAGCRKMG